MLFLDFRLLDLIDILLVALLIYQLYKLMRGTVAINIFIGVIALYLIWKLVEAMRMELLSEILGQFIGVGVIAVLIVFQQELRKFLLMIGTTRIKGQNGKWWQRFGIKSAQELDEEMIDEIMSAVAELSKRKLGAIIVFSVQSKLGFYCQSGTKISSQVSAYLIESIFQKNSPLHDGALIIVDGKIEAAGCVLPVSDDKTLPSRLGTRHRATVGITEQTDAIAVAISEETGEISFAKEGKLLNNLQQERLKTLLLKYLS